MCECIYPCKGRACLCVGECSVHGRGKMRSNHPEHKWSHFHSS